MTSSQKKKSKAKGILLLIITALLIHLALNMITISTTTEHYETKELPTKITGAATRQVSETELDCTREEYRWAYRWEGYNEVDSNYISPRMRFQNKEDRSGTFHIELAFFDSDEYSFADFENSFYEEVQDDLPWDAAAMHSDKFTVVLKGGETQLITPVVEKADRRKQYWAYAKVTPPTYPKCISVTYEDEVSEEQPVLQQAENKLVKEVEKKTLWEILTEEFIP